MGWKQDGLTITVFLGLKNETYDLTTNNKFAWAYDEQLGIH